MASLFLVGCVAASKQIRSSSNDGEVLYRSHCGACHRLRSPGLYTYDKLKNYVEKYGRGLTAEERRTLLNYLKEVSKQ